MMVSPRGSDGRDVRQPAGVQPAGASCHLGEHFRPWQCAMEELREMGLQCSHARKTGQRELALRLGGEMAALTLRCDLLLARAVADARGKSPAGSDAPHG